MPNMQMWQIGSEKIESRSSPETMANLMTSIYIHVTNLCNVGFRVIIEVPIWERLLAIFGATINRQVLCSGCTTHT